MTAINNPHNIPSSPTFLHHLFHESRAAAMHPDTTYRTISKYEDLDDDLAMGVQDIILAARMATFSGDPISSDETDEIFKPLLAKDHFEYWNLVFHPMFGKPAWNTDMPIPQPDLPDKPKHQDLRSQVGFLIHDAPPSKNALRKPKRSRRVALSRRRGQRAFVEPRVHPNDPLELQWFWCDEHGKGIDPTITSLHTLATPEERDEGTIDALIHRDYVELVHAASYNTELTVYWMRCRLMRALQTRFPDLEVGQRASNPTAADFDKLLHPLSLGPRLTPSNISALRGRELRRWQHGGELHTEYF